MKWKARENVNTWNINQQWGYDDVIVIKIRKLNGEVGKFMNIKHPIRQETLMRRQRLSHVHYHGYRAQ